MAAISFVWLLFMTKLVGYFLDSCVWNTQYECWHIISVTVLILILLLLVRALTSPCSGWPGFSQPQPRLPVFFAYTLSFSTGVHKRVVLFMLLSLGVEVGDNISEIPFIRYPTGYDQLKDGNHCSGFELLGFRLGPCGAYMFFLRRLVIIMFQ